MKDKQLRKALEDAKIIFPSNWIVATRLSKDDLDIMRKDYWDLRFLLLDLASELGYELASSTPKWQKKKPTK
jgi:hypothetical protein